MASVAPPVGGAMGRRSNAFSKRGVFALVLFGIIAFISLLYFIGSGQMTGDLNNGRAHAASKGITGYAALVRVLEARGDDVSVSRSEADLDNSALLVIAPPNFTSKDEISELIEKRTYQGPTLIILPKWFASQSESEDAKPGWVEITTASGAMWNPVVDETEIGIELDRSEDDTVRRWTTPQGKAGRLPKSSAIQFIDKSAVETVTPFVSSGQRVLAGLADREDRLSATDDGYAYGEETYTDESLSDGEEYYEESYDDPAPSVSVERSPAPMAVEGGVGDYAQAQEQAWRVMIVAEPDLLNNWGMADEARAQLALDIIDEARGDADLPIIFDLTINGLGTSRNLLTLAFEPPFLAATLCLILAMLLVGWRAFKRFGPALVSEQTFAFGKSQLVENGAGVIQRTGRLHLLTVPYAKLKLSRLARKLGLRNPTWEQLDKALERRNLEPASPHLAALENAIRSPEILRAARALHSLERKIVR